jgi:uncharacterized DUF497 family protein
VLFEWDDRKNESNFRKHGIWFEEAQTVWTDPTSVEFYDPAHSNSEDRFIRFGRSIQERMLLVVFCEREDLRVRIISARRATPKEIRDYEKGI